jgi:hypothetical protein
LVGGGGVRDNTSGRDVFQIPRAQITNKRVCVNLCPAWCNGTKKVLIGERKVAAKDLFLFLEEGRR